MTLCDELGIKVIEYADKFEHHHVPGPNYVWEADHGGAAAGEVVFLGADPQVAQRRVIEGIELAACRGVAP